MIASRRMRGALVAILLAASTVALLKLGRRPFVAAWRAFRDPSLIDRRPAPAPRPVEPPDLSDELDRQLADDYLELSDLELLDEDAELTDLRANDLPLPTTRRALRFVRFYTKDPRGRQVFEVVCRRSGQHREIIEQTLREARLPEDLVWVAAAESGFDPLAESPAGARGLWQIMPETARELGLEMNGWLDERLSITASTRAAARHLRGLLNKFGSWDLALSAYNLGEQRVAEAIDQLRARRLARREQSQVLGAAQLAHEGLLPKETADYVPRITALALVAANLKRFRLDHVVVDAPVHASTVLVPAETPLATVARAAGVHTAELRRYNPELLLDATPPGHDHPVALPAERLDRALASLPVYLEEDRVEPFELPGEPTPLPPLVAPPLAPSVGTELGPAAFARLDGLIEQPRWMAAGPLGALAGLDRKGIDPLGMFAPSKTVLLDPDEHGIAPASLLTHHLTEQLGFLSGPPIEERTLAHGVTLRLQREEAARTLSFTVRFDVAGAHPGQQGEIRFTEVVDSDQLDVGVALAVGRLGAALEQARALPRAALRARLNRHRRLAIEALPDGAAYLALADALYPSGDPLQGSLIDPRGVDAAWIADRHLLATMPTERAATRASITLVGGFEPTDARARIEHALERLGLDGDGRELAPVDTDGGYPRRISVAGEPRILLGWRAPGIEEVEHDAVLVAAEIIAGRKRSALGVSLVETGLASKVRAIVDTSWEGGAVVVEIVPNAPASRIESEIASLLARLRTDGPTRVELEYARAMLGIRLRGERERIETDRSERSWAARTLEALSPGHLARRLEGIDEVDARDVQRVVQVLFDDAFRVLVHSEPSGESAMLQRMPAAAAQP